MSQILIQQYLNQLQDLRKVSGTHRESVVREAFKDLLKGWARAHDLVFVPEYEIETKTKDRRYVDGALLYELRMPFGYWEAKDEKDDLDAEIEFKFRRGYPQDNIIFEDSTEAVLIQNRQEVMRCGVDDVAALEKLLNLFFGYERVEIAEFRHAVEQFKTDLPAVLESLRAMIARAFEENAAFRKASQKFLAHAQGAINPGLTDADVREMLIQHVLTEEIFSKVFGEDDFHQHNNVAKELYALEETFFTGDLKKRTLRGLGSYYAAIRAAAAQIGSHHEKQAFLKVIYENFYKVYNVKAADRLGVVYTPNEIVRFMVESADWLCEKHFGRNLIDKDVEILDPAAGTGTFICELLEHFRGQKAKLRHKYLEELHANEVAILPYYVANLNIEATYAAITGDYLEYPNLCFVDTLDNVGLHTAAHGTTADLFGSVSEQNLARIKRQNSRKISVIIGNPPYNANQANENDNNKNREYPEIDKRIKNTYIAESTAQKTKLYDMYARFFRWASDRLAANGVLAFISNRSFIESRTFDGFRKVVAEEFNDIYVVDLGGDVRANPKLSGTKHNVFGIQTGVAISFMVKRARQGKHVEGCRIYYARRPELETAEEKLEFLSSARMAELTFDEIRPDTKQNWVNLTSNDFDSLLSLATKDGKSARNGREGKTIFSRFSLGISTNRDDWAYGDEPNDLLKKVEFFSETFHSEQKRWLDAGRPSKTGDFVNRTIKWTAELETHLKRGSEIDVSPERVYVSLYRPFVRRFTYFAPIVTHRAYQNNVFFPTPDSTNTLISVSITRRAPFSLLASDKLANTDMFVPDVGQCFPLHHYVDGHAVENITDWALDQFKKQYQPGRTKPKRTITKEAIFHYVYGVLHDPVYREKYALNLKREFPRIPFYADFWQWADWGKTLMDLHIGYEAVEPFDLNRVEAGPSPQPSPRKRGEGAAERSEAPKAMLKADREAGRVVLDTQTALAGIPPEAWDYKLGNRSALEWILDQYKEKKPKDPTIREKFDTYRFADYKEKVIDLLMRVTRVSVETRVIVEAMGKAAH
ncbi:MAG: N-6 DNA methylase [Gallionella sp.]|nr:N-6 DNA methylase [Gallionella sp.]